jgi:sulfur-oxidizing protein SoxY
MTPSVPAPSSRVARRAFLLAGAAAGLAWLGPRHRDGSAAASPPRLCDQSSPHLRLPALTENGAKVPITVEMDHPMEADHHVTVVRVVNDRDPVPAKGEFHFTRTNGQVYLAYQARLDDGYSNVRVEAECTRRQQWSSSGKLQVASGGGGCAGAAPAPDQRSSEIRPPVIRLPHLLWGRRLEPGHIIDVQVKLKHPVRTGLALRNGQFVPVTEPFFLTEMEVLYGSRRVSRFVMTPALADDPLITFRLRPEDEGLLRVVFRNSRGAVFEASQPIRFA